MDDFHQFILEIQKIISKKANASLGSTGKLEESSKHTIKPQPLGIIAPNLKDGSSGKKSISIQDLQNSSQKSSRVPNLQVLNHKF